MHIRITGVSADVCLRVCLLIQYIYTQTRLCARLFPRAGNFPLLEFESGCIESNNELSTDNAKGDFSISLSRELFLPPRIIFLKRPTGIAFDGL